MKNLLAALALCLWLTPVICRAEEPVWEIESLSAQNEFVYDLRTGSAVGTNGVIVKFGGAVMTADRIDVDQKTGQAVADGNVHIQREDQVWVGDHINYNFKTRVMQTEQFRTGKPLLFASGRSLNGNDAANVYQAGDSLVTMDDYSKPGIKIRTRKIKIVPGKYFEARNALLYLGDVPVFYLPYYRRNLGEHANNFNVTPGWRSRFGPFLLGSYTWYWQEELDGALHLDYRVNRGVGAGPDVNYHLGRWGDGSIRYYYLHDQDPNLDNLSGQNIPADRQRVYFSHLAEPYTNLTIRSQVRYLSDPNLDRDFFESQYRRNPQPSTYAEINKFWDNFSFDAYAQPRINNFYETIERLPDLRLTGYRQQLWNTPIYYQSESSFAYLRHRYALTNGIPTGLDYSAARADTYHELLLPYTLFGWLNLTPRMGGRFTYYTDDTGPGGVHSRQSRAMLDTGMELSFKSSRTWPGVKSKTLDLDGLRHLIEPSANYVYSPNPSRRPPLLPQFDYMIPSLRLRPIDFPEMNSIDAIDGQNTIRLGLRNKLQTKRAGQVTTLLNWEIFTDWRLDGRTNQTRFSNVYSDIAFSPRNWITFESEVQYDVDRGIVPLAYHTLTLAPNDVWSWSLTHRYLRDDATFGVGNNLIGSSFFYRLNENWGVQFAHYFEARDGRMDEQYYTLYRDFRSWTSALTFRAREPRAGREDFTIALTFSLKGRPRYGVGADIARPLALLGNN